MIFSMSVMLGYWIATYVFNVDVTLTEIMIIIIGLMINDIVSKLDKLGDRR